MSVSIYSSILLLIYYQDEDGYTVAIGLGEPGNEWTINTNKRIIR
jgi:hypothetical protein